VSDEDRARLMREWPEPAVAEDLSILTAYPKAGVITIQSALQDGADAGDLALALLATHGPWRRRLVANTPARLAAGLQLAGRAYAKRPELQLAAGVPLLITGISTENGRLYKVRLFG
jgi:hypothetical protein